MPELEQPNQVEYVRIRQTFPQVVDCRFPDFPLFSYTLCGREHHWPKKY